MNFSRQALLGIGMIIGGSVMLYAMAQQISDSNKPNVPSALIDQPNSELDASQPLTTDIETEKRILAQKQKERAARVAEQEMRARQFLTEQEAAEAEALAKARAESQQYVAGNTPETEDSDTSESSETATPQSNDDSSTNASNETATSDSIREQQAAQAKQDAQKQAAAEKAAKEKKDAEAKRQAEAKKQADAQAMAEKNKKAEEAAKKEPPKSPSDYQVKRGDGLIKLARQYNMPVDVLAQANNLSPSAALKVGQNITIPSRTQVQRLEREAAAAEKSAKAKREAQQKLSEARKEAKETDAKGSFGVQVALANDQGKADELAKKLQAAGYQVKTSPTSRGVRVIVGPERGKVAALALKDKINSDPQLNATEAWVLYWR